MARFKFTLPDPSGIQWRDFPDPPELPDDTKTRQVGYINHAGMWRPNWCAGAAYLVQKGTPPRLGRVPCNAEAVFPTALCPDCTERERNMRDDLRLAAERAAAPEPQSTSRSRWTK